MRFDVPEIITDSGMITMQYWQSIYQDKFTAKLALKSAIKVYWRTRLSEQQNHRCCWCGIRMSDARGGRRSSTIEHVIPKSKGGEDHPDNYAVACHHCNTTRGNLSVDEFLAIIDIVFIKQKVKAVQRGHNKTVEDLDRVIETRHASHSIAKIKMAQFANATRRRTIDVARAMLLEKGIPVEALDTAFPAGCNAAPKRVWVTADALLVKQAIYNDTGNVFEDGSRASRIYSRYIANMQVVQSIKEDPFAKRMPGIVERSKEMWAALR